MLRWGEMLHWPVCDAAAMARRVSAWPRILPSPASLGFVSEGRIRRIVTPLGVSLSVNVEGNSGWTAVTAAAPKMDDEHEREPQLSMGEETDHAQFFPKSSLTKPLDSLYPRRPCRLCGGACEVLCHVCEGKGRLNKGGHHKKNPVSTERIIGSKWTAMESTFGWRHFCVRSKRRTSGKDWFVEMSATCDETTRFWINLQNLKDRELWSMGWLQKSEIFDAKNTKTERSLICKACKGEGRQPCKCTKQGPGELTIDIIEV